MMYKIKLIKISSRLVHIGANICLQYQMHWQYAYVHNDEETLHDHILSEMNIDGMWNWKIQKLYHRHNITLLNCFLHCKCLFSKKTLIDTNVDYKMGNPESETSDMKPKTENRFAEILRGYQLNEDVVSKFVM